MTYIKLLTSSIESSLWTLTFSRTVIPLIQHQGTGKWTVNYYKWRLFLNLVFDKYKSMMRHYLM